MCTRRRFSSCDGILKYKLKVGLVIECAVAWFNGFAHSMTRYLMVYFIKFYFTYTVSNWDPNLHFMR